jgi:hypothetical protein
MMATYQIPLSRIDPGHYYTMVGGALYEVVRRVVRRGPRQVITWDLYQTVNGEREPVQSAETLEAHRQTLARLAHAEAQRKIRATVAA